MKGFVLYVDGAPVFLDFANDVSLELTEEEKEVLRDFIRYLRTQPHETRSVEERLADAAKKLEREC